VVRNTRSHVGALGEVVQLMTMTIGLMIAIAELFFALATFTGLMILLRAAWQHRFLPRDFPRAIMRRKRERGAAKRPAR
jgi:hypothetical protein